MNKYLVEYIAHGDGIIEYFVCLAENSWHAEEQCLDAYPHAELFEVYQLVLA
jgi:hypothetical protein